MMGEARFDGTVVAFIFHPLLSLVFRCFSFLEERSLSLEIYSTPMQHVMVHVAVHSVAGIYVRSTCFDH